MLLPSSVPSTRAALVLLATGALAVAEEATLTVTGDAQDAFQVGKGGSATKLPLAAQENPQAMTTLSREQFQSQGVFSLRDALKSAPGLTMAAGEGGRTGDSLAIRGFAANSDLYVDGLKDNGQYFRDTFNLEQVEILRGSSAVLFGRGSTGGAVNSISRTPTDTWTAEASGTLGSWGLQRLSAGAGGPVSDIVGVRGDAFVQRSDSFRDEQQLHRAGVAPSVGVRLGERTTVLLQYVHQREDSTMDYGIPMVDGRPADVGINRYYGFSDDAFQEYRVHQATASVAHRLDDTWTVTNRLRRSEYSRDYRTEILGAVNYTTMTIARTQALRHNDQQNTQHQLELTGTGTVAGRKASLVVGQEVARESYRYQSKNSTGVSAVSIFGPNTVTTTGAGRANDFSGTLANDSTTDAHTWAGYVLGTLEVIDRWTVVGGLRYEVFDAQFTNHLPSATDNDVSRNDVMTNPRVGLVFQPTREWSTYVSYSTASNPSAETYTSLSATTADLEPERTHAYEAGAKASLLDDRLTLGAALFRLDKVQARTTDTLAGTTSLDGRIRTEGLELEARGKPTERWTLAAGVAVTRGEILASDETPTIVSSSGSRVVAVEGNRPVNTPAMSGTLWSVYDLGAGFSVGGGATGVSSRYANAANTAELPGYLRLDASVAYTARLMDVAWFGQANLNNLLDTVYYESGSATSAYAGAPRNGQLTVGASF